MVKKVSALVGVLVFLALGYLLLRGEVEPLREDSGTGQQSSAPGQGERAISDGSREPADGRAVEMPEPTPLAAEAVSRADLPPLEESDPFVRERLEPFDLPQDWVARDDLVRRLAVLVDNATRGNLPRRQLRFLKPEGRFEVVERDGRLYADLDNGDRFDPFLDLLERIEPEAAARLLIVIEPLLEAAFRELGRPTEPEQAVRDAIDRVVDFSVPTGDPALVQRKVLYEYADPKLESLPPLEKQMLRLGARNLGRFQAFLIELRAELDLAGF